MTDAANESDSDHVDFEATLEEVDQVVRELEGGQLGLTESLEQYERGIKKIKRCHDLLERAEQRVSVLMRVDEDGTAHVEPVETEPVKNPENSDEKASTPRKRRSVKRKRSTSLPPDETPEEPGGLF
ncbi:MAG: exodeoxyribonuclease VII small subunit [Planctomycetota bacterium]